MARSQVDYRSGSLWAFATSLLLATQAPFSALAATSLNTPDFIGFTQIALVASVPLLVSRRRVRRDLFLVLGTPAHWPKLLALLLVGLIGLGLYDVGLSAAHPIVTAVVLNLAPFWAALVARVLSGTPIPLSAPIFFGCFFAAFCGAMIVGWSQVAGDNAAIAGEVWKNFGDLRWLWALPMPVFFALSGTLVFRWFSAFDESAVIGANFLVSAAVLAPTALLISHFGYARHLQDPSQAAVLLLLLGTLAASAAGRVAYQQALSATGDDNGFVTMFFLAIPVLSTLISAPLSIWIPDLRIYFGPLFFAGMGLILIPLLVFSLLAVKRAPQRPLKTSLPRSTE